VLHVFCQTIGGQAADVAAAAAAAHNTRKGWVCLLNFQLKLQA
jgi:hypothetical protein